MALWAQAPTEDLRAVREALGEAAIPLTQLHVSQKKAFDGDRSLMVVAASGITGVFIVAGPSNRVLLKLDQFTVGEQQGFPRIDIARAGSAVLDFHDDYDLYYGSIKYFYDLSTPKPPLKVRFAKLALLRSNVRQGLIVYTASALERGYRVTVDARPGQTPAYTIADGPAPSGNPEPPATIPLPDGAKAVVTNTPVGQAHQLSGITITDRAGKSEFYAAPVPTMEQYRKMRRDEQAALEIENDIGPAVIEGQTIWYANRFYDGEGTSGVGGIGSFDLRTHKYDLHYFPEIAAWSGSALRLDGEDLWIGLMRQPEGAAYGGGLLRYNRKTGAVAKFPIPDVVNTIDRAGDAIYCGTSNGLYWIRGGAIRHLFFEPDARGKLTAISAAVSAWAGRPPALGSGRY